MATPEPATISDETSAAAHISTLLSEPDGPPEEEQETPQASEPEEETAASEAAEDAEEAPEEPQAAPDGEGEELPDTLAAFADALEIDPSALSEHLRVPVKVNGELREVPLSEAIKGYQLESDYTQKTMKVAERERELNAQAQQMTERWQHEAQRLQAVIAEAESLIDSDIDPNLLDVDPIEYQRQVIKRDQRLDTLDRAREEQENIQKQQYQAAWQQTQHRRAEQQKLLTEKLNLTKPEQISAFEQSLSRYLQDQGYETQEVTEWFNSPFDHRHIVMMDKARKYDALQKGQKVLPKKLQGLPKVVKPGVRMKQQTGQDKLVASKDRLKRLKTKGTRQQQTRAAVDMVRDLL